MSDPTVFALAFAGYIGLAGCFAAWARGRLPRWLAAGTAVVIAVHVGGVWTSRYGWSIERALQNGWAPFLIFHAALACVLAGAAAPARWSARLMALAFPIVTAGALGAAFRRPEVQGYRWPLLLVAAMACVAAAAGFRAWRRERGSA